MMTGEEIIGDLLLADATVADIAPPGRIKIAQLPEDIALPAILIRLVSLTDRKPLKRGPVTRSIARIGVTIRAGNVRDLRAALAAARDCCAGRVGDFGGARNVSILTADLGPSLIGPGNSFEITQDFHVSFEA
jgi:hypothetical protein